MGAWTTHRGDEWWYLTSWGKATAAAGAVVTIDAIQPVDHHLSAPRLHEVLWTAWQQFHDSPLLCALDAAVRPCLDELAQEGVLQWELIDQPSGQDARLLAVLPFPAAR